MSKSLKWGKRDKSSNLLELKSVLPEGGTLSFIEIKPSIWLILASQGSEVTNISTLVAGLLDRFFQEPIYLKELKYDSPEVIQNELREFMGYIETFNIKVFASHKSLKGSKGETASFPTVVQAKKVASKQLDFYRSMLDTET